MRWISTCHCWRWLSIVLLPLLSAVEIHLPTGDYYIGHVQHFEPIHRYLCQRILDHTHLDIPNTNVDPLLNHTTELPYMDYLNFPSLMLLPNRPMQLRVTNHENGRFKLSSSPNASSNHRMSLQTRRRFGHVSLEWAPNDEQDSVLEWKAWASNVPPQSMSRCPTVQQALAVLPIVQLSTRRGDGRGAWLGTGQTPWGQHSLSMCSHARWCARHWIFIPAQTNSNSYFPPSIQEFA